MDPTETFRLWQLEVLEENKEESNTYYYALIGWLSRKGFEPDQWHNAQAKKQFMYQYNPETGRLDR